MTMLCGLKASAPMTVRRPRRRHFLVDSHDGEGAGISARSVVRRRSAPFPGSRRPQCSSAVWAPRVARLLTTVCVWLRLCACMVARGPVVPRRHLTGQVDYERVLARPYVGENGQEVQGTSGTATCCLLACRDGRRQKQCGKGERRPAQLVEMLRAFCGQC